MALSLNKARVSPIAIDFGADTVKLLQLAPGPPPHLVAAAAATLPSGSRQKPAERVAAIGETLRSLLRAAPFRGRRVICSIPAFQMLWQQLDLSAGEGLKTEEQIGGQLRERLGIEPRNMVLRHFPVGGAAAPAAAGRREVVCIAARRQVVMQYIETCRQCKLEVIGMHAEPYALLEAMRGSGDDGTTRAVIDIGAATTKVLVVRGGELVYARSIHAGGDQVTRRIAVDRGVDFDEARRLRSEEGDAGAPIPAAVGAAEEERDDFLEPTPRSEPARSEPVASAVASSEMVECLTDELKMGLRYYHARCPEQPVQRLIFVGGQARDTAACTAIAKSLGIAAQLGDPLGGVVRVGTSRTHGADLDGVQPAWAVARGLASCEANV